MFLMIPFRNIENVLEDSRMDLRECSRRFSTPSKTVTLCLRKPTTVPTMSLVASED